MSTFDAQVQHLLAGAEPFARSAAAPPARRRCAGPDMRHDRVDSGDLFSVCTVVAREAVRAFRMCSDTRRP